MSVRATDNAAHREWHLAAREPRVILTLAVVAVLTVVALGTGWQRTQLRLERQQAIERNNAQQRLFLESAFDENAMSEAPTSELTRADKDRQLALQMTARSPDLMRFTGGLWTTYLPASQMVGLSMGAAQNWPDHYRHAGASVTQTLSRDMRPNPLLTVTGAYDFTLFIGAILPLAVLILTFDVSASDRETGRWTLVETHSRSLSRLMALRCFVRVVAIALVVGTLVALWMSIFSTGRLDFLAITRLATLCVWLSGYLAFWGALAYLVASFRVSSAGAGLILLLCWCVLVLFVPAVVKWRLNRNVFSSGATRFSTFEERAREDVEAAMDSVWAEYLRQHPNVEFDDDNPQLEFLLRDIAQQNAVRSQIDDQLQAYFGQFLDREDRVDWSQLLTPALAWRTVAEQYAGTSVRHYADFAAATAEFHGDYIGYFEPMTLAGRELSMAEVQSLPRFDGRDLARRIYVGPLLLGGTSILIWTCFVGLVGWQRLQRTGVSAGRQQQRRSL